MTLTNFNLLPVGPRGMHLRAILQQVLVNSISNMGIAS